METDGRNYDAGSTGAVSDRSVASPNASAGNVSNRDSRQDVVNASSNTSDAENEQFERTIRYCLAMIRSDGAYMKGGPLRSDLDSIIRLEDPELLESFWQYVIKSLPNAKKRKKWINKEREKLDQNMDRWREIVSSDNERSAPTGVPVVPKEKKATPTTTDAETNGEAPARDSDTRQIPKKIRHFSAEPVRAKMLPSSSRSNGATVADAAETATPSKRKKAAGSKVESLKKSKKKKATGASTGGEGEGKSTGKSKSQITDEERHLFAQESRENFEKEKAKILNDLDDAYVARFGTIGFCVWSKKTRPVILLSPYDVAPNSQMRKDWMKMYNKVGGSTHDAVTAMLSFRCVAHTLPSCRPLFRRFPFFVSCCVCRPKPVQRLDGTSHTGMAVLILPLVSRTKHHEASLHGMLV